MKRADSIGGIILHINTHTAQMDWYAVDRCIAMQQYENNVQY